MFNTLQPSVAYFLMLFSDVFRGYRKVTLGCNGLILLLNIRNIFFTPRSQLLKDIYTFIPRYTLNQFIHFYTKVGIYNLLLWIKFTWTRQVISNHPWLSAGKNLFFKNFSSMSVFWMVYALLWSWQKGDCRQIISFNVWR